MADATMTCSECGGAVRPIRVVEQDHHKHYMLKYVTVDAQPSWFFGAYAVEGHLSAELCEACGRVSFRAVPRSATEASQ
jgi:hypothetical protein